MRDGIPALISEWMNGGTLSAYLSSRPDADRVCMVRIPQSSLAQVSLEYSQIDGIARGLEYLHSKNIVHSDLKPVRHSLSLTTLASDTIH